MCKIEDRMLRESSGFGQHGRITSPEKFSLFLPKVPLQFRHVDISLNLGCSSFAEDPQALCGPEKECCVAWKERWTCPSCTPRMLLPQESRWMANWPMIKVWIIASVVAWTKNLQLEEEVETAVDTNCCLWRFIQDLGYLRQSKQVDPSFADLS